MSIPINNDPPDEAQEIVYQHQRTVHGYNDNQISAQIIDNVTDTLSKNSSTQALGIHQDQAFPNDQLLPTIGFWERKLMRHLRSKSGKDDTID